MPVIIYLNKGTEMEHEKSKKLQKNRFFSERNRNANF